MLVALEASDASMRVVQLRVLRGAAARVPADATAFAHRSAPIFAIAVATIDEPDQRPRREAWAEALARDLDQGVPGAYVNFVDEVDEAAVRRAYPPATWDRLAAIKARYDPTNLFRHNANVPPAG